MLFFGFVTGMVDTILNAFQVLCLLILIAVKVNTSIFGNDVVVSETNSQFHEDDHDQKAKEEAWRSQETQTSDNWRQVLNGQSVFRASSTSPQTPSQTHTWPLISHQTEDTKIMLSKYSNLYLDENASDGWEYLGQRRQGDDTVH